MKEAKEQGKPIGILNLGGVRGEEAFFPDVMARNDGEKGMRCNESASKLLPMVVDRLRDMGLHSTKAQGLSEEALMDHDNYESTPLRTPS